MNIVTPEACDMCGTIHVAGEHEDCRIRRLIAAKDAEIAALRDQRDNAQIAVAMKQGEIADLSDQIAALRERCGRLANEVMAWRRHDAAFTMIVGVTEVNRLLSFVAFYRTSGEVCEAMQQVNVHNDLAPAAGKAQEKTDGT